MQNIKRYGAVSIALHWIMVILIVLTYAFMEFKGIFPKNSAGRDFMKQAHFVVGLTILVLVGFRIVVNAIFRAPPVEPPPPAWQLQLAKAMHVALYVLMVGLPVLGWLTLSAKGEAIPFWGMDLAPLVGPSESLGKLFKKIHEAGATIGYVLIGTHAAAALFHHYVMRDSTLLRMLPGRKG